MNVFLQCLNDFTRADWTRLSYGPWDLDNESALTVAKFILLYVWPVILPIQTDRWSPFHTPYCTFVYITHPTSPIHISILYQIFMIKVFIFSLSIASFAFYNVCVCCQLNKSILTLLKGEANVKLFERNRFPLLVKPPLDVILFSDCHLVILLDLVQTGQSFLRQGKDDATKA